MEMDSTGDTERRKGNAMIRYHEATDASHVAELAASMEANGWQGAPLVLLGESELLTGAHRHTAYVEVFGSDYGIPTVLLEDLFTDAGLDLATVMEDEGCEYIGDGYTVEVIDHLPVEIRDEYGIDIH